MHSLLTAPIDAHALLRKKRALRRELLGRGGLLDKRVAVLGGSTTAEMKDMLELFLLDMGIRPTFHESGYNRYAEDVLYPEGGLRDFAPELVVIHTSSVNIARWPGFADSADEVDALVQAEFARFEALWQRIEADYGCAVIQNNFELPQFRATGNLDAYATAGRTRFVALLNERFASAARERPQLHLNDIHTLAARFGLDRWYDLPARHAYKYAMSVAALPQVAHSVASIVSALLGKSRKCLVLDLDNTLWGGVIGDDGLGGIQIGQGSALAEAHAEFQHYVLLLKQRGVILAVCSKNDEAVAREAFSHPDSVLRSSDFSAFVANWEPKDRNIVLIAQQLNIGLDALVFVDDNPAERDIVRAQLPEVCVPEMGSDVVRYIDIIEQSGAFESIGISADDTQRSGYYAGNRARDEGQARYASHDEFLRSLKMRAEIGPVNALYLDRVTQLINKTNQFNLTTRRCTLAETTAAAADPQQVLLYGRLVDAFGDNGIVTVLGGRCEGGALHIELWLMSCRVLKRGMEAAMLDELVRHARAKGLQALVGRYVPTAKNGMVARLLPDFGFEAIADDDSPGQRWRLDITNSTRPLNTLIEVNQ